MRPSGIVTAGAIALTCALAGQAAAQDQQYETPLYTTGTQAGLDKNYGLPTFGMPGSELPQQKTMATKPDTPAEPTSMVSDFFKGTIDLTVPRQPRAPAGSAGMETPRYTTSYGTTGDTASLGTTGDTTTFGTTGNAAFGTGTRFGTAAMETETDR
jgi:hypothetical protein